MHQTVLYSLLYNSVLNNATCNSSINIIFHTLLLRSSYNSWMIHIMMNNLYRYSNCIMQEHIKILLYLKINAYTLMQYMVQNFCISSNNNIIIIIISSYYRQIVKTYHIYLNKYPGVYYRNWDFLTSNSLNKYLI